MNLPLLELVGVEKRFGFHQVLRNIELKLNDGEFILLLGNNGAGKSTLLKIICLLMKPTAGEILHRGEPLQEQSRSWLKLIGSLTHESRLYRDLTAQENLMVYGTLYDLPNLSQRIEHALEETGLTDAAKLPVHTFSSGMNKRLRIGRLIMLEPKLMILDEPFSGLDQNSVNWFLSYLEQYHRKGGTVMMVTHQLDMALKLSTRVLVLKQQKIMKDLEAASVNTSQCEDLLKE